MKKLVKVGATLFGAYSLMEFGTYLACMAYVVNRNGERYAREADPPTLVKDMIEEHNRLARNFRVVTKKK